MDDGPLFSMALVLLLGVILALGIIDASRHRNP